MLSNILLFAVIIERIWEYVQLLVGEKLLTPALKLLGSLVLSCAASVLFELDLILALGAAPVASPAGMVLTGFVISLGSNVVHDLVGLVNGLRNDYRPLFTDAGYDDNRR